MHTAMKKLLLSAVLLFALMMPDAYSQVHGELTSAQMIEGILSEAAHRDELTRLKIGIATVLADARLTDQATRQMIEQSQVVLDEMLNQKVGTNVEKLIEFAKWMTAQSLEKIAIHDSGGATTPQQQFVLDNPIAGQEVYLTSVINWILREYLEIDGEASGALKLESYLQLYFSFRKIVERSYEMPDWLLLKAPNWIQPRFQQLTVDQKRQFLKDTQDSRAEIALGRGPDEEPGPPPTPQEQAAYDAAYQFILSNTPQP